MKISTYQEGYERCQSYYQSIKDFHAKDPIAQQALIDQGNKLEAAISAFVQPYFAVGPLTQIQQVMMSSKDRQQHEAKLEIRHNTSNLLQNIEQRISSLKLKQKKMNCCQNLSYKVFYSSKKED